MYANPEGMGATDPAADRTKQSRKAADRRCDITGIVNRARDVGASLDGASDGVVGILSVGAKR